METSPTTQPDKKPAPIWPWILAIGVLLIGVGVLATGWSSASEEHRTRTFISDSQKAEKARDHDGECNMISTYTEDPTDADCDNN